MLGLSPLELFVLLVVVLLLFGGRLPKAMRSIGRSITEFRRGQQESAIDESDDEQPEPRREERPPAGDSPH